MKKILVADDHPVLRKGLVYIIKTKLVRPEILEADNGKTALDIIRSEKPEIAVLDVDMPGMKGTEVCRKAIQMGLSTKLIVLTMHNDDEIFKEVKSMGVSGFLLKDNAIEEIVTCINTISEGKTYFSEVKNKNDASLEVAKKKSNIAEQINTLTYTENKILQLIAKGKTSEEIAGMNFTSIRTVDNHRANICKKLNLKGNNALLMFVAAHKESLM